MKIVHFDTHKYRGGAEVFVASIADYQASKGHEVVVATLFEEAGWKKRAKGSNWELEHLLCNKEKAGWWKRMQESSIALKRLVDAVAPDFLHSHLWPSYRIASRANLRSVKHVWHLHDTPPFIVGNTLRDWMRRRQIFRMAQRTSPICIGCGAAVTEYCRMVFPPRISFFTARNGVDVDKFSTQRQAHAGCPLKIGMAAAFRNQKDHATFIESIGILARDLPASSFKVRLAGEGALMEEARAHVQRLKLEEYIDFLGHVDDPAGFYKSIDVHVLSSHWEGVPLSVMESMAAGCLSIASDVSGVNEVIEDGVTGYLVPPRNPGTLACLLHSIIENFANHASIAEAGQNWILENGREQATFERILDIYGTS